MTTREIVAVSSGLLKPKKSDHLFARRHRYLNYGLLSLATVLDNLGHRIRLYHGGFQNPRLVADVIAKKHFSEQGGILLLSLPSCFAIPWAQDFLAAFRASRPAVKVLAGGRWVVQEDGRWIRTLLPQVDLVVYGTAESRIERLVDPSYWPMVPGTDITGSTSGAPDIGPIELNFRLDSDFPDFQPSIEISRGCGMRCAFCEERATPLSKIREPGGVIGAIRAAMRVYEAESLNFYFEASMFLPNHVWADDFQKAYRQAGSTALWRCETRVDSISVEVLEQLAGAGLRVIDLGLESACPVQLVAMGKTREPLRYLERASRLLRACYEFGVWPKVNVMLYAGETAETAAQTVDWLARHRNYIKGVSVGPIVVYGHNNAAREYLAQLGDLGARPVQNASLETCGYARLHLSREIDYERSEALSLEIAREFMTEKDYFDLKSFSYFPRTYRYSAFLDDLGKSDLKSVPFSMSRTLEELTDA